jgi:hypothetical protein
MAQWVDIPLAVTMGEGESTYASDVDLLNLMLVPNPPGSRKPYHIASTPTLDTSNVGTIAGNALIRGMQKRLATGDIFIVKGTTLYSGTGSSWTSQGTVPGTAPCRMVDTETHMVIVDGTNARAYNYTTDTVQTPSIEGFIDVVYQDGYTIYADAESNKIYVSSLDDPTTIGALDFTTADSKGGTIKGLAVIGRELFAIKEWSIEYYFNGGGAGFPFVRGTPGLIDTTCVTRQGDPYIGTHAVQVLDGVLYWIGDDMRVYAMQGHQVTAVSTPWVDRWLRENLRAAQSYVWGSTYSMDGSSFYMLGGLESVITPTTMVLVYDATNRLWHRRTSAISAQHQITHAVVSDGTTVYVVAMAADTGYGTIYKLDPGGTKDTGASSPNSRTMTLPQVDYGATRAFMPELLLDMEKPATTGTITLSWSDDGGSTYTSGVTNTGANPRTRWQRLGSFYQRILRLTFAIDSKLAIMGVRARIEGGE